ncbi:hypothetical protein [Tistrella mobilis]
MSDEKKRRIGSALRSVKISTKFTGDEEEGYTIREWFDVTDRVFKVLGWFIVFSLLVSAYIKTSNVILLMVAVIIGFFLVKLFSKIFQYRFCVVAEGIDRRLLKGVEIVLMALTGCLPVVAFIYLVDAFNKLHFLSAK